jgi:hypothetical protein
MKFELTPTTQADLDATEGEPLEFRVRAVTAKLGDQIIGVGGLGFPKNGQVVIWARLTDEIRKRPVQLHKTALAALADAKARGIRQIVALADPTVPASERWLERLGFDPEMHLGKKVYVWRP